MDADNVPIVVPFVHTGMQEIMPVGTHFPKIGGRVHPLLFVKMLKFMQLILCCHLPIKNIVRYVMLTQLCNYNSR